MLYGPKARWNGDLPPVPDFFMHRTSEKGPRLDSDPCLAIASLRKARTSRNNHSINQRRCESNRRCYRSREGASFVAEEFTLQQRTRISGCDRSYREQIVAILCEAPWKWPRQNANGPHKPADCPSPKVSDSPTPVSPSVFKWVSAIAYSQY